MHITKLTRQLDCQRLGFATSMIQTEYKYKNMTRLRDLSTYPKVAETVSKEGQP